jgi:Flp pilus assembly protein TadD
MKGLFDSLFRCLCCIFLTIYISACGGFPSLSNIHSSIPPLSTTDGVLSPQQAHLITQDFDLLHVSEQMLALTDPYVSTSMPKSQRAELLNMVLRGSAFLNIDYRVEDTLTAEQAFLSESANCVGYANLYIALARHYGLSAKYRLIKKYPQWNRQGGKSGPMMSLAIHLNSVIDMTHNRKLVVDLLPRITRQVGHPEIISDEQAKALFYNNLGVDQFFDGNYADAYGLLVKAISLESKMDMLWVNLGTLFRHNGQINDAETAFKMAIDINPNSYTAMNNLAVLYQRSEDWSQFAIYLNKTRAHREKNPYYHLQLAKIAEQEQDYLVAIKHIKDAIRLKKNEPEFHETLENLNQLIN